MIKDSRYYLDRADYFYELAEDDDSLIPEDDDNDSLIPEDDDNDSFIPEDDDDNDSLIPDNNIIDNYSLIPEDDNNTIDNDSLIPEDNNNITDNDSLTPEYDNDYLTPEPDKIIFKVPVIHQMYNRYYDPITKHYYRSEKIFGDNPVEHIKPVVSTIWYPENKPRTGIVYDPKTKQHYQTDKVYGDGVYTINRKPFLYKPEKRPGSNFYLPVYYEKLKDIE